MSIIWLTALIPSTINSQAQTLFTKQGTVLDRSIGPANIKIPAASLVSFVTIAMLLSIPLYDRLFVPFMHRRTDNPSGITLLQRIGTGFAFHVLVMLVAFLVEVKRMKTVVPMSIFWLIPQYVLLGIGGVFNVVGVLEFFYDQSPEGMKSLGTTFNTSAVGAGNLLNSFLVTIVDRVTRRNGGKSWIGDDLKESHLDYYYAFLIALSAVNLVAFVVVARGYRYKNEIVEGGQGNVVMEKKG